ncbi:Methyltransferase type 12 [Desulfitobacterium hafniense]|uniref:Methyltransferase type 12 n=1 Tax=Desulfitobacterium hafniense TaxID=49338 RepID=A0A098B2M4_DESHA|nr:class I SAM-dependent methyltransferase [Desulfitobacterium hafniense]CDX03134.1 Methyltransferase type 12 [Desulfitobacterium hafniense]
MNIAQHYRSLFLEYGDAPQAAQWTDLESQEKRFQILNEVADLNKSKVLDLGCGTAHLATYFKKIGINVQYTGIDIVEELLKCAAKKHPEHRFCGLDEGLADSYDYVLISGVFNNSMPDNRAFYREMLKRCFMVAHRGLAFNMLSHYVDYYDEGLFYEKPEEVFTFVKQELSPFITIRNDYQIKKGIIPYEFTVYVYKDLTISDLSGDA